VGGHDFIERPRCLRAMRRSPCAGTVRAVMRSASRAGIGEGSRNKESRANEGVVRAAASARRGDPYEDRDSSTDPCAGDRTRLATRGGRSLFDTESGVESRHDGRQWLNDSRRIPRGGCFRRGRAPAGARAGAARAPRSPSAARFARHAQAAVRSSDRAVRAARRDR